MHELAFRNVRAFTSSTLLDLEVAVDGGRITEIAEEVAPALEEVDGRGRLLLPGLVDDHVHFRQPGKEQKEDFASGTRAATHGGVTTVFEIQNNPPLMESREAVERKLKLIRPLARANVGLYANATPLAANRLGELADLVVGIKLFLAPSHGDDGIDSDEVLRAVFQEAARLGKVIVVHAEDRSLINRGMELHAAGGARDWSRARPPAAEVKAVERVIRLSETTGARIHLFHLSTAGAVDLLADAKQRGLNVTGATCPHYLIFTDEDVVRRGGVLKCNPSIKSNLDRTRLREGVREGIIDVIETDHAPHLPEEKMSAFQQNPSGISTIDFFLPLLFHLLEQGVLDLPALLERCCGAPSRIFGLPGTGSLEVGDQADMVLVDDRHRWTPGPEDFLSKASVSPYVGFELPARVERTYVAGKLVYSVS
ncbi:MAG: dihydroorotase family protein [Planctomycetota bacterium]